MGSLSRTTAYRRDIATSRMTEDDCPLVALARAGERAAFDELVRRHADGLFAVVVRLCRMRTKPKRPKKGSGRKQGGQPGHPGRHRELLADPDRVVEHWPDACGGCGAPIGR